MPATTYTPPHLRASSDDASYRQSASPTPSHGRLPATEFEDTRTMGPALHYFYTHSPSFQRCRQMKRRYGDNDVVNQKFAQNRERSRNDDQNLAPMFRDQFYAAFSDMVDDLGGPECLLEPNQTTGAARFVRRFADLGCAPGGFAQYLLTTFPQCTAWALPTRTANPNVFCLEILALIRRLFASEVRSTKGRRLHEIRSAYYIVGQGYKGANADVLRQLDEAIRTLKRRGAMSGPSDWSGALEDDDDVAYTGEAAGSCVVPTPVQLLLHPHLTEIDILRSDGPWLMKHYEPLWTRQADALERALARVSKPTPEAGGADRRSWRRSGAFELDASTLKNLSQSQPRSRTSTRVTDEQYAAMVHSFETGLSVGASSQGNRSRRPRAEERWM
ncbi:hypothetical protein B0J17DRAFT_721092 [Rhizoctonia solani]|nr:hypothetical protein B0J17DRAFT_721092 [Rhizoctonia solani]